MTDRLLYATPFPEEAQEDLRQDIQSRLSATGAIQSDTGSVTDISVDPNQQRIVGIVKGAFSELNATELEELFGASNIEAVPYHGIGEETLTDGYYALENVGAPRPIPQTDTIFRVDGNLRRVGTRRSHFRSVKLRADTETNPFGSDTTEEVGLSSRSAEVKWWDQDGGTLEDATVQRTETGKLADFDVYDATEPSFAGNQVYQLVYSIPYEMEAPSDVRLFDDYDRAQEDRSVDSGATVGSATVGSATVGSETIVSNTWQRVYRTDHEYIGKPVMENQLLRVEMDEDDGKLRVYEWDDLESTYGIVQLGTSDWRFKEADIRHIDLSVVAALLEFEDTTSPGTTYHLIASLQRGIDKIQFWEPELEGSGTPSGLVTRLNPVAGTSDQVVGKYGPTSAVADRAEVKQGA